MRGNIVVARNAAVELCHDEQHNPLTLYSNARQSIPVRRNSIGLIASL